MSRSVLALLLITVCASAGQGDCYRKANDALNRDAIDSAMVSARACLDGPLQWRILGAAFHHRYQADSAFAYLTKAYGAGQRDDSLLVTYAEVLLWKKQLRTAGDVLALLRNPRAIPARKVEAQRLEMGGRLSQALAVYDSLVAVEPDAPALRVRRGEVLAWLKRYDEAREALSLVAKLTSTPAQVRIYAMMRHAETVAWQKRYAPAVAQLDSLVEAGRQEARADPLVAMRLAEVLLLKGQILEWQAEFAQAKSAYADARAIEPANAKAQLNLERLLWVK